MKYGMILSFIIALSANSYSDTINVPADQPTIQAGINAAVDGDIVLVAPGTYVERIMFKGKKIMVISSHGPNLTVIDGMNPTDHDNGSVVIFVNNEGSDSKLDGFSITNGKGTLGSQGFYYGGGIYCYGASPILSNNVITGNSADCGGGISCHYNSSATIKNNIISSNIAFKRGGGISCRKGNSYPLILNNIITKNSAMSGAGGGIYHFMSYPIITNNVLYENEAEQGGGIFCYAFYGIDSSLVTNSIIWNNKSYYYNPEIYIYFGNSGLKATYCDIKGGWPDNGNIDADPLFIDPANNDFHLTWNSPCRNTGDNTVVTELTDFEGDPRISYGIVDMGADEFHTHLYWTGDPTPGGNVDIKITDIPGTMPVVLWAGTGVLDPPVKTIFGDWYLQLPVVTTFLLGSIPANGVLHHPRYIPLDYPCWDIPIQSIVGNQLTNLHVMEIY